MPLEAGSPTAWLRHARSDLAVARGPAKSDVLPETLCFHAQQAVEKGVKAVLASEAILFPRTHNLKILLKLLPSTRSSPVEVSKLAALTDYAASARYPGEYEAVTEEEYREAVQLAEAVVKWAETIINPHEASGE